MNKNRNPNHSIPSILSIPEKIEDFWRQTKRLRLPTVRSFSLRSVALATAALLMLILETVIPALRPLQTFLSVPALLLALVPAVLQGRLLVRGKLVPVEEITVTAAALLAFLLKQPRTAVLAVALAVLLWQVEAYSMLHVDAAPDALSDAAEVLRSRVLAADEEKSDIHRAAAFTGALFFGFFVFLGVLFALVTLFHLQEPAVWLRRSMLALLLAGPSAALFTSRLTHFAAVFCAAKSGAAFRSDNVPECFARCRIFAFGKTGTVTEGKFQIVDIAPIGVQEADLLRIAAVAECRSAHPVARTLKSAAGLQEGTEPAGVMDVKEVPGKGVSTFYSGHQIYVGNAALMEEHDIWYNVPSKPGTAIHVALDAKYRGYVLLSDALRPNAFEALEELRAHGAKQLAMLTGDVRSVSRAIASSLNFDMVKSELSSEEKASAVRYLRSEHGERTKIAAVGDGNHDVAMFEAADVSICLQESPQIVADLNISSDEILTLPLVYRICRDTGRAFLITSAGLAVLKILLLILGLTEALPLWLILITDCLAGIASVLYALTCLTLDKRGS